MLRFTSKCVPRMCGQRAYAAAPSTQVRWSDGHRYWPAAQRPQPLPLVSVQEPSGHSENSPRHPVVCADADCAAAASSSARIMRDSAVSVFTISSGVWAVGIDQNEPLTISRWQTCASIDPSSS